MKQSRQKHSAAFKAEVVFLARDQGRSNGRPSGWLSTNTHPSQIHAWKKALLDVAAGVFENGSDRDDKTSEIQVGELYRQIGQLKVENDFLARRGSASRPGRSAWGHGEIISTTFAGSTVNLVVSRRFAKKQQMQ